MKTIIKHMKVPCQLIFGLRILLLSVCLFWAGAIVMLAADRYVRPPGTGANPTPGYTTWSIAATNIQTAVNVCVAGDTVWVSNGSYRVTNQITITNRITVRSVNGYTNTSVYAAFPDYTNRCFYVANTGTVDGFTISNGYLAGSNNYSGAGGAFVVSNATIKNCYFVKNVCSNAGLYSGGGGVWVSNGVISNCVFFQNQAITGNVNSGYGGGAYCFDGSTILDSTFTNNTTCAGGGGIAIAGGKVRNCTIANNNSGATLGGGVYIFLGGSISNSVIFGNTNSGGGAGVYAAGASGYAINIAACRISNNICRGGAGGGGVSITNNGQIRSCLIVNNTNMSAGGVGGGILLGDAALYTSTVYGVINCTIVNNYSTNEGGGIAVLGTSNYIANCIFSNNTSSSNIYPDVYNTGNNSNNYWYCCANPTSAPLATGQGNITSNPLFFSASAGNWRLDPNSPCINAGTNQSWMTNAFDLDGHPRIRNSTVDMGAYERTHEATIYRFFK